MDRGFLWQQDEFRSSNRNFIGCHGRAFLTVTLQCGGRYNDILLDAELDLRVGSSIHSRARNHEGYLVVGLISVSASTVQRPPKFNGTNFKIWKQKLTFFFTILGFAKYIQQDPPQTNEENDPLVAMVNQAWYHNNYLTINYILEGLADTLYPTYAGAKLAKELWDSLKKKYQAKDAETKKFIIGKMLDYKMVDNKSVVPRLRSLRKKKPQQKKKTTEAMCAELDNLDLCAVIPEVYLVESNPMEWFVDTGATCHICSNRSMFHEFQETSGDKV
ncbi:unnamed protein product [Cuscuta campestris]|uniref:Retrovirus-related Pol polyprotein from transposon TNT 1-94-like beta-barrel domain-containing protein n=1 Tax=Cuscuta campestris TaxID=132261 RepID=A0A484NS02_9ASTE|nr:unnamed protein product [Cuscuta campestris]